MFTHTRRAAAGIICGVVAVLSWLVVVEPASAHHVEVPSGDGRHFVWPASAWVAATDDYHNGNHHGSGSADLAAPHFTPVRPARPGTVEWLEFAGSSGWYVRVRHETAGDRTYYTAYVHLATEPLVEIGQRVDLDTPLGYVSRLGRTTDPHLHFRISVSTGDGPRETVRIPDLTIGDWVRSGGYVPGVYDEILDGELEPIDGEPARGFDVEVIQPDLWVYESTSRKTEERMIQLSAGDRVTVVDSHRGQYRILVDGEPGWIPSSGVIPDGNTAFGVEVTGGMNVRRGPGTDHDVIGWVEAPALLTGSEKANGWSKVTWKCNHETNRSDDPADNGKELGGCDARDPGDGNSWKYGWIGTANTEPTDDFPVRTMVDGIDVHANQVVDGESRPDTDEVIAELPTHGHLRVTGSYNGWYRFEHEGQTAWLRGWHTTTRR